jgi:hypothetical protein
MRVGEEIPEPGALHFSNNINNKGLADVGERLTGHRSAGSLWRLHEHLYAFQRVEKTRRF